MDDFAEFYRQHRDPCLRAVAASVADQRLAEELVAEAFARAWARWPHVATHPAPAAWVVRTALNTRVSWWRRRRREVLVPSPRARLEATDRTPFDDALLAGVRLLPARQREVVALRVLLDLDVDTTARVLGIAPGTVTAHLARAVATLRRQLVVPSDQSTVEVAP